MIKLLIADDSALMRKLLGEIFAAEGDFEIRFARNGKEALDLAKSFQPDVVTLDVHMPEMNGLDCLNRIMIESPRPVVMVSSLTDDGAQVTLQALDLGGLFELETRADARRREIDEMRPAPCRPPQSRSCRGERASPAQRRLKAPLSGIAAAELRAAGRLPSRRSSRSF